MNNFDWRYWIPPCMECPKLHSIFCRSLESSYRPQQTRDQSISQETANCPYYHQLLLGYFSQEKKPSEKGPEIWTLPRTMTSSLQSYSFKFHGPLIYHILEPGVLLIAPASDDPVRNHKQSFGPGADTRLCFQTLPSKAHYGTIQGFVHTRGAWDIKYPAHYWKWRTNDKFNQGGEGLRMMVGEGKAYCKWRQIQW